MIQPAGFPVSPEVARGDGGVTIVIPGRDCEATLDRCLAALRQVTGPIDQIIFVNDGSRDGSRKVAEAVGVQVLEAGGKGAGAARNVGWKAASSPWIWFVDADCVAQADALHLLTDVANRLGAAAVGGSYENMRPQRRVARLIHAEMCSRHKGLGETTDFAITANLLCRRDLLLQLGGFDEHLRLAQDLDLAYRIRGAGAILGFCWRSRVAHFHEDRLWPYLLKQARQGYWRMHLYRKHPRKMSGDRYSGLLDYLQPPLGLLLGALLVALVPAWASGQATLVTVISAAFSAVLLLLLALQLPMTLALGPVPASDRFLFIGFGALRACARGVGMALGILSLVTSRASRGDRQ